VSTFVSPDPDDEDRLRSVRAALSLYVGGALPPELTGTAELNGVPADGWVFPPTQPVAGRHEDLSVELVDAGVLLREHAEALGVVMLVPGDPGWPAGTGADDLPCLWVTGGRDVAGLLRRAVTVTGEHTSCTGYGLHVASELGVELAQAEWTVVASAFGQGIAGAAARGVRAVGGRLLLVAAHGPDQAGTPVTGQNGEPVPGTALVSPFPPGTAATWPRVGVHRRLLGTLTAGTVVVEAATGAGCLEVTRAAAEDGRVVCAVPGPVTSAASRACHDLIGAGVAQLTATAADVIANVTGRRPGVAGDPQLYRITARASWEDGYWRSRKVPDFYVAADFPFEAALRGYEVVFAVHSQPCGDTLVCGVLGPDGGYETVQVSSTS
jgi:DNA processing protein